MKYKKNLSFEEMPLGQGEGCVLFDGGTGNTIVLDDIAFDVLRLFDRERSEEEAVDLLLEKYEGDVGRIRNDVKELIDRLVENGLLQITEKE